MNTKKLNKYLFVSVLLLLVYSGGICQKAETKINYTSFTVNAVNKKVMIDWVTDNKTPTNYFEIERSTDGKNFRTVALVMGPDPQKPDCDCYECFDKLSGGAHKYFYRLKHVSQDGEIELSETRMLALK